MNVNTCFVVYSSSDASHTSQAWSKKDLVLRNRKHALCLYQLYRNKRKFGISTKFSWLDRITDIIFPISLTNCCVEKRKQFVSLLLTIYTLGVFLSRLIVRPRKLMFLKQKYDVLKTNICPRSEASRAIMLVLRPSNFQGATIGP